MPSGSPPDGFSMKKGLFKTGKKGYNGKQMLFLVDKLMKGV
ncbi:hypothetical protein DB29_00495 [Shouchella clausii]|jgi:hypothetical protein|nr:hypothetical protein DB29_00495 [Shouchella clausii]